MRTLVFLLGMVMAPAANATLVFDVTLGSGISQGSVQDLSFQAAANYWSSVLTDSITVTIQIGMSDLPDGVIAEASVQTGLSDYSNVRLAMDLDSKTATDTTAVSNLPNASSISILANNPNGSPTPGLTSTSVVNLTVANAKALGFPPLNPPLFDATILFDSGTVFDFDPTDGITPGAIDFTGAAAHEVGHALGFVSGVDFLDAGLVAEGSNPGDWLFMMDLFRFSGDSWQSSARDFTADSRSKYFSLNGPDAAALFSTGVNFGDGQQASHWQQMTFGIMGPTAAQGQLLFVSGTDLTMMDALGWDVSVPEPATITLCAAGLLLVLISRARRGPAHKL